MKKEDNILKIKIFYLIAQNEKDTYKLYYSNYEKFQKELKYYVLLGYDCQVGVYDRELLV